MGLVSLRIVIADVAPTPSVGGAEQEPVERRVIRTGLQEVLIAGRHLAECGVAVPSLPLVTQLDMKVAEKSIPRIQMCVVLRIGVGRVDAGLGCERRIPDCMRGKLDLRRSVIEVIEAVAAIECQRQSGKRAARRVDGYQSRPDIAVEITSGESQLRIGGQGRIDGVRNECRVLKPPTVGKLAGDPGAQRKRDAARQKYIMGMVTRSMVVRPLAEAVGLLVAESGLSNTIFLIPWSKIEAA